MGIGGLWPESVELSAAHSHSQVVLSTAPHHTPPVLSFKASPCQVALALGTGSARLAQSCSCQLPNAGRALWVWWSGSLSPCLKNHLCSFLGVLQQITTNWVFEPNRKLSLA